MSNQRLQRILELFGERLMATAHAREPDAVLYHTPATLLAKFAKADPSRTKAATQWLVTTYIKGGFRLEDLSKAHETLTWFKEHRRKLSVKARDLGRYETLADLWNAVKPFVESEEDTLAGRALRRQEREAARNESKILWEGDDGFTVVVPMTERAAKYWGRGTRWCTSADKDNSFLDYHVKAPLVILILPGGEKFQIHAHEKAVQFMDAADAPVSLKFVKENWFHFSAAVLWVVRQTGLALEFIPETKWDLTICLEAVRRNAEVIPFLPNHLCDKDVHLEAVRHFGSALQHVPLDLRNREICMAAVCEDGKALRHVPAEFRDMEMCRAAVRSDGPALGHVPEELRDMETCLAAVQEDGNALGFVPAGLRDRPMCLTAVGNNGLALKDVPEHLRDRSMCLEAVRIWGSALQWVPEEQCDPEMCSIAINQDGNALFHVPKSMRGREMCFASVRNRGNALRAVPESLRDYELCLAAVEQDGWALENVPKDLRDMEMYVAGAKQDRAIFQVFVPENLRAECCAIIESIVPPRERNWDDSVFDSLRGRLEANNIFAQCGIFKAA